MKSCLKLLIVSLLFLGGAVHSQPSAPTNNHSLGVTSGSITLSIFRSPAPVGGIWEPAFWLSSIYKDSVNANDLVAQGDSSVLTAKNLPPGVYIAVEADSGSAWERINGKSLSDTITLGPGASIADTFVNFKPNSITVTNLESPDGYFGTANSNNDDCQIEIHADSANGPIVAEGDTSILHGGNLADGKYTVFLSYQDLISIGYTDSVGYNAASAAGQVSVYKAVGNSPTTATITLVGGQYADFTFIEAPAVYGTSFRTFTSNQIATSAYDGKIGVEVAKKIAVNRFSTSLTAPSGVDGLVITFGVPIDTSLPFTLTGGISYVPGTKLTTWTISFPAIPAASGTSKKSPDSPILELIGADPVKPQTIKKAYWTQAGHPAGGPISIASIKIENEGFLPEPNALNVVGAEFADGAFTSTGGLVIGLPDTGKTGKGAATMELRKLAPSGRPDPGDVIDGIDVIIYHVRFSKYTDVEASLYAKGKTQSDPSHGFDTLLNGKPMKGTSKTLPPTKYNSKLFGDLIALKVNIAASLIGITSWGYGNLIYRDTSTINPYNGLSVSAIAASGDTVMDSGFGFWVGDYDQEQKYAVFDNMVAYIDSAFSGAIDTVSFADSLKLTGVRALASVPFLHAPPGTTFQKTRNVEVQASHKPVTFKLYQNYPNPFNPTTSIQFDLAAQSSVTLKVYNILGQEVRTLFDHTEMTAGQHIAQFNASNFASGMYFYRISALQKDGGSTGSGKDGHAGTFSDVKKMLLIK